MKIVNGKLVDPEAERRNAKLREANNKRAGKESAEKKLAKIAAENGAEEERVGKEEEEKQNTIIGYGLERRAKDALQYAQESLLISSNEFSLDTKPLTGMEDLTSRIAQLDEKKDRNLGILRNQNDHTIVRDARNVNKDKRSLKKDAGEKYAIQILNQVRGSILLIETSDIENKQEHINQLLGLANQSLTEIDKLPKKIKSYNSAMLTLLAEAGVPDPAEKLNFAKEIASFKDTHKNIITLTSVKGKTIAESEVIIELTPAQKAQYSAIAEGKREKIKWYNELAPYQKALIKNVAGDIATGRKVIPAQLRDLMGLRNAYEKTTAILDEEPEIIVKSLHCGAPASENEFDASSITDENIKQLKAHARGKMLNLNILSSWTSSDTREENWITEGLESNAEGRGVVTSSSPINRWRHFNAKREQEQFDLALKNLGEKIDNPILKEYLTKGKGSYKKALAVIESLPEAQKIGVKAALHARKNLNKWNIFKNKNVNLEISADMLIVETSLEDPKKLGALYKGKESELQKTISFCKSGKDRTGLVMLIATKNAVRYALGLSSKESIKYLETLAAAGHTQGMAGKQGGSLGCDSIKMSLEFRLPRQYKSIEGVIDQESAKYNSKIKIPKTGMTPLSYKKYLEQVKEAEYLVGVAKRGGEEVAKGVRRAKRAEVSSQQKGGSSKKKITAQKVESVQKKQSVPLESKPNQAHQSDKALNVTVVGAENEIYERQRRKPGNKMRRPKQPMGAGGVGEEPKETQRVDNKPQKQSVVPEIKSSDLRQLSAIKDGLQNNSQSASNVKVSGPDLIPNRAMKAPPPRGKPVRLSALARKDVTR